MTEQLPAARIRAAVCKDCLRRSDVDTHQATFSYPEAATERMLARGGSRSDRCTLCRRRHRMATSAFAVAYVDVTTVGSVRNPDTPTGPLGGLGPLPKAHDLREEPVTEPRTKFGMSDDDVERIIQSITEGDKRVAVVKAGTGTGKSTFMPFRLAFPPEGAAKLTDNGPIIVTEPRVQATVGVATYVGTRLCRSGIGPGSVVGYQAQGTAANDSSNRLIYVTDGSAVNWLTQQRHANWGAVIVDEAHERSVNIDLVLAMLKRDLAMYPQLRVIVTSATFDVGPIAEFFGDLCAEPIDIEEVDKKIGYYPPLFPGNRSEVSEAELKAGWSTREFRDPEGEVWDLWDLTRRVERLRAPAPVPLQAARPGKAMEEALTEQLVRLCHGLDEEGIEGDIVSFLPTRGPIEDAVKKVRAQVDPATTVVYDLMRDSPRDTVDAVTAPHAAGQPRRVVVATNIAETSLTLDGFRFVVDTGVINAVEWLTDAEASSSQIVAHSKSGIRQRWGRVGRTIPGWVFPLYSRDDFDELDDETPPGSLQANLEALVLKAVNAGFTRFDPDDWPASACGSKEDQAHFEAEFDRAKRRLSEDFGAIDECNDLTEVGREAASGIDSIQSSVALRNADQLNCVPEVAVTLSLWKANPGPFGTRGVFGALKSWPPEFEHEHRRRIRALLFGASDSVDVALAAFALWEQADPSTPPWEVTEARRLLASRWWLNVDGLEELALGVRRTIDSMSSNTRSQKYRPVDFRLADRARAALAYGNEHYRVTGVAQAESLDGSTSYGVVDDYLAATPGRWVSLTRQYRNNKVSLDGIVKVPEWCTQIDNTIELIEAAGSHGADEVAAAAHAVRTHYPIGATLSTDASHVVVDGFHRPQLVGRGPSDREGNFLDDATRLLAKSGQLDNADVPLAEEDDVELSPPTEPPRPEVVVHPSSSTDGDSGVVAAYQMSGGQVCLLVEPDLAPHRVPASLDGSDLAPAETVELVVGPVEDRLRQMIRSDGRGWFALRVAGREQPAVQPALDEHDHNFVSDLPVGTLLRGTVVPNQDGGNTVSLLPDLLDRVRSVPVVTEKHNNGSEVRRHRARVATEQPNKGGYIRVALEDGSAGLPSFSVKAQLLERCGIPVKVGNPLLVRLAPVPASFQPPNRASIAAAKDAGYVVREYKEGPRLVNPGLLSPDPAVLAQVADENPALLPSLGRWMANSLAQTVIQPRAARDDDVFDTPTTTWQAPEWPSWLVRNLPAETAIASPAPALDDDDGQAKSPELATPTPTAGDGEPWLDPITHSYDVDLPDEAVTLTAHNSASSDSLGLRDSTGEHSVATSDADDSDQEAVIRASEANSRDAPKDEAPAPFEARAPAPVSGSELDCFERLPLGFSHDRLSGPYGLPLPSGFGLDSKTIYAARSLRAGGAAHDDSQCLQVGKEILDFHENNRGSLSVLGLAPYALPYLLRAYELGNHEAARLLAKMLSRDDKLRLGLLWRDDEELSQHPQRPCPTRSPSTRSPTTGTSGFIALYATAALLCASLVLWLVLWAGPAIGQPSRGLLILAAAIGAAGFTFTASSYVSGLARERDSRRRAPQGPSTPPPQAPRTPPPLPQPPLHPLPIMSATVDDLTVAAVRKHADHLHTSNYEYISLLLPGTDDQRGQGPIGCDVFVTGRQFAVRERNGTVVARGNSRTAAKVAREHIAAEAHRRGVRQVNLVPSSVPWKTAPPDPHPDEHPELDAILGPAVGGAQVAATSPPLLVPPVAHIPDQPMSVSDPELDRRSLSRQERRALDRVETWLELMDRRGHLVRPDVPGPWRSAVFELLSHVDDRRVTLNDDDQLRLTAIVLWLTDTEPNRSPSAVAASPTVRQYAPSVLRRLHALKPDPVKRATPDLSWWHQIEF